MNNKACSSALFLLICFLLIVSECFTVESDPMTCKPSGKVRGKNPPRDVTKTMTPIVARKASFTTFTSVPHEFRTIPRICGGGTLIGWFNKTKRCRKFVKTYGNGRIVLRLG
ncbi:hypothetical protein J1N35_012306 [Gossypium stocksii]|uniref:BPTI/Kunitz inhibitor domain-containing protein n=1 Tax=Gossypium stocksii TaxID=47602 RepID=A0A9D4AE83_9ROSI|nr:hypothetical protein J1N35_012306 [Gossypium stocksii]